MFSIEVETAKFIDVVVHSIVAIHVLKTSKFINVLKTTDVINLTRLNCYYLKHIFKLF